MRNETDADDRSEAQTEPTSIYMAGSIDHSDDDGRGWRNDLQNDSSYAAANVEFLNPLSQHDPQEHDFERSDVVSDDLSLLDEADGILLKYEHGRRCWGTPSEQGYALAVNRHTDRDLPVAVWWDELGQPLSDIYALVSATEDERYSLEDASPWLHDPKCAIGVYSQKHTALVSLLSSTGHGADSGQESPATHGFLPAVRKEPDAQQGFCSDNPYPCEVDGTTKDTDVLFEGSPLEEVLEVFCTWGVGTTVPREVFDDIFGYDDDDVAHVIGFLNTLDVTRWDEGYTIVLEDTAQSRKLLERFVDGYDSSSTATGVVQEE